MPLLNLTEYARHRGVYPRAVEVAIQTGRIHRDERGLIDSDQADQDWESGTSPYRSAAGKANGAAGQSLRRQLAGKAEHAAGEPAEAVRKPVESATSNDSTSTDIGAYARSRAQREHYEAALARLRYEERLGHLIHREAVEKSAREFWGRIRLALLAMPDRLAAELAAETDPAGVRTLLTGELKRILTVGEDEDGLKVSYGG